VRWISRPPDRTAEPAGEDGDGADLDPRGDSTYRVIQGPPTNGERRVKRPVSSALRCAAAAAATAAVVLALGCGAIDRMTGVTAARELQAAGVAAEAEVLSLWDTGITVNQDPVIGLKVEVRPKDRPPYQATIAKSLVSRLDVPRFQPGRLIPVRFDPRDPARVAIDVYKYR